MRTVIWGAPCSGKTTYVKNHASEGDVICDYDSLFQALSGLERYKRIENLKPFSISLTNKFYDNIEEYPELNAWIISANKKRARAEELAEIFQADLIVLEVSREEAHRRCDQDGRPYEWHQYIDEWFDAEEGEKNTVNKSTRKHPLPLEKDKGPGKPTLLATYPAGEGSMNVPRVRNAAEGSVENEIWLYGEIWDDSWYEFFGGEITEHYGIWTPKMIRDQLRTFGSEPVTIHIHSAGGFVDDASAMRAIISAYPGEVTCKIDGLCASAAVMVAISGDRVVMQDSAYLMIHDPWTMAVGGIDEMKKAIKTLQATKKGIVEAYQNHSTVEAADLEKMMSDETWLTGEEALAYGFVDEIVGAQPEKVAEDVKTTMNKMRNVLNQFRNVPEAVKAMIGACDQVDMKKMRNETGEEEASALETLETEATAKAEEDDLNLRDDAAEKERDEAVKALREKIEKILKEER